MAVTTNGDVVNYMQGPDKRTAQMVVAVAADGSALAGAGSDAAPNVLRDAAMATSDLSRAVVAISTATTTVVVAAVSGQTTRVHRLRINVGAAQSITVRDGASNVLEVLNFTAAGFMVYDFSSRPWYKTAANSALSFITTTTGAVNAVVEYITSA